MGNNNYLKVDWKQSESSKYLDDDIKCILAYNDWEDFYKKASLYLDLSINPFEYFDNPFLVYCTLSENKVQFQNADIYNSLIHSVSINTFIKRLEKEYNKDVDKGEPLRFVTFVKKSECSMFLSILETHTPVVWEYSKDKPTSYNPFKMTFVDKNVLKFYCTDGKLSIWDDDRLSHNDERVPLYTTLEFIKEAANKS